MSTETALLLSSSRRRFIASAAGAVVAGLAAASPISLLSRFDKESVDFGPTMPMPKRLHLDLNEAKRIASQFVAEDENDPLSFLDITDYASASLDALDHLAYLKVSFVSLGFEWIDPAIANRLARWQAYFLIFDNLGTLTPKVTRVLNTSSHPLIFSNLKHLDNETANYLVDDNGYHPLDIHIPGALSLPLARVLSRHSHELSLSIYSLEPRAAKALSGHQGYYLHVVSKLPFSDDSLRAFSGNAMKCLTTDSGEYGYKLTWKATDEWWYRRKMASQ